MRLFDKLLKQLRTYLDENQIPLIERAYQVAQKAHEKQKRQTGEPYIIHPIAVASILADMKMAPEIIMSALLHDVVEDTEITREMIAAEFGEGIAGMVEGASKLKKIAREDKAEAQAGNFQKMLLAMAKDIRVILVKLADRLHNMRTLDSLRLEKQQRIAQETLEIYVPIAKRLGVYGIYRELENLSFRILYPQRYATLEKAVRSLQGRRKNITKVVRKAIWDALAKAHIRQISVMGREKALYSIYRKMQLNGGSLEAVMDIHGFRILVSNVQDCYAALGVLHHLYKPVFERFKDYIAIPKANGYQSLHTTLSGPYGVPLEVQIRTYEMEADAANGVAGHWIYKQGQSPGPLQNARTQAWLENILELQQKSSSSLEFVENVKADLFPNDIYVFTPRGDILELPSGATVIDFAYAVHSDIGNHCIAAKMDRKFVPLNTTLTSGSAVEILTSPQAYPKISWLEIVKTGKARGHIKDFVKKQHRTEAIELGQKLLESAVKTLNGDPHQLSSEKLEKVLQERKLSNLEDLYHSIGLGEANQLLVAQRLLSVSPESSPILTICQPVSVKGTGGLLLKFATCCYPIPPEKIVGTSEVGQGLTVHSVDCHHVVDDLKTAEKYLPLQWDEKLEGDFPTAIRLVFRPQEKGLQRILKRLLELEVSLKHLKFLKEEEEEAILKLVILVKDRKNLAEILRQLRQLPPILRITRKSRKKMEN